MRSSRGLFITFEGVHEGIGKTTQAELLAETLRRAGYEVVLTRESGGTALGRRIREILLDPSVDNMSKATELFLQMADRAQHYKEVLKPSLKRGAIVISDRYFDSTLVYQGAGRGWKSALLWRLHHATTGSLLPHLTIVLNGQPHVNRGEGAPDRIESEDGEFFSRVGTAMLHIASKDQRYAVVDANQDAGQVAQRILDTINERKLLELVVPKAEAH